MSKVALLSGTTGQDASYLADFLLEKDYEVYGIIRRVSTPNVVNIKHNLDNPHFHLIDGDLTDLPSLIEAFKISMPDEAYNLAAMSFVGSSWVQPVLSANVTGLGALNFYEAARLVKPDTKVYQASTSEMYNGETYPQNETTHFHPKSPYGVSKLFAHEMARIYRESYDMFISCGILFNHESGRRGIEFVTQKIVDSAVRQLIGKENFVLSSGETHSIREFCELTYNYLGEDIFWLIEDGLPVGVNAVDKIRVKSVLEFWRCNELNYLLGDSSKARGILGWRPEFSFHELISEMIESKVLALNSR